MQTAIRNHFVLSMAALSVLVPLLWEAARNAGSLTGFLRDHIVTINVEHQQPAELRIEYTVGKTGILQISNETETETIHITVPDSWQRKEVRNAVASDITGEASAIGTMRWPLPPMVALQFWSADMPTGMVIQNPNGVPVKITTIKANLQTESVEHNVTLVQDEPTLVQ